MNQTKNKNIYSKLPKTFFVLAPMDDVTDVVFRQIVAECALPDLFFTEFVNVDGLQSVGRPRLLPKLRLGSSEDRVIAQLWGKNPENYFKTVSEIVSGKLVVEANQINSQSVKSVLQESDEQGKALHNFIGVDINMGCPDKTVVKNGCCSALINNRQLAKDIITACQQASKDPFPISVKTRVGFTTVDLSWIEFLLSLKLNALTIHLRTAKEMSKVPAHWELMEQIVQMRDSISPTTKIIGNGDITSYEQGVKYTEKFGLDGIMIGRGIFNDPYVFAKNSQWQNLGKQERIKLYKKQIELFTKTWQNQERRVPTLNKFCKIYIQNFEGAKELREKLMKAITTDNLIEILNQELAN